MSKKPILSLVELACLEGRGYHHFRFGFWDLYVRVIVSGKSRGRRLQIDILPPELAALAKPLPKKAADVSLFSWWHDPLFGDQLRVLLLANSYSLDEPKTFYVNGKNEVVAEPTR